MSEKNGERLLREQPEKNAESPKVPCGWSVLFLANGFTDVPEASGGTKHFIELARHWLAEGQGLSVMTPEIGVENCEMEGFDGPFRVLGARWADRLPVALMYAVRSLLSILYLPWGRRGVCLYATSDMMPDVLPAFIFRILKPGSSFWVNCVFHLVPHPRRRPGSKLTNFLSFAGQRAALVLARMRADMLVVDNELLKQQLVELGFRPERIFVTFMGTDGPGHPASTSPTYDACFLGRLHPSKGIFDLVNIWRVVCDARPGARLAIAGGGPHELAETLACEIDEIGLHDMVDLLGYVSRDELRRILAGSKVFVFPSYEEGFGISILEAMGFGLPVVAYELPHYRGIFSDALSMVPVGDIGSFSLKVLALLGDEVLREKAAMRSRELAARYTWRSVGLREAGAIVQAMAARRCD